MTNGRPFTKETAPRQGGKRGRKNKLSAQSMRVIDALMQDFAKHGATAIATMRIERPSEYVKVMADIASRWVIAAETGKVVESVPPAITVTWLTRPPEPSAVDKVPMLELAAAETEGNDDAPATPAS